MSIAKKNIRTSRANNGVPESRPVNRSPFLVTLIPSFSRKRAKDREEQIEEIQSLFEDAILSDERNRIIVSRSRQQPPCKSDTVSSPRTLDDNLTRPACFHADPAHSTPSFVSRPRKMNREETLTLLRCDPRGAGRVPRNRKHSGAESSPPHGIVCFR